MGAWKHNRPWQRAVEVVNRIPIVRLLVVVATNFKMLGTRIAILLLKINWQTVRKSYRS